MNHPVLFVTGIDTDAGKTYATAFLARRMTKAGLRVITQKFIQTGCRGQSEDIVMHRRLCGLPEAQEDREGLTAPVIFSYPASAQLAARLDGREIDLESIRQATAQLASRYDTVLIEGAGGLMVPITEDYCTIDYIVQERLPVVLVTNGRLGSINHTLLSLEAIASRGIELAAVVYNEYFDSDKVIAADTRGFLERRIARLHPGTKFVVLPKL